MIYHIEPIYESFVWGGRKLIDMFKLPKELENIGMIYSVIGISGELDNRVIETGQSLSEFYKNTPEVFGCNAKDFPVRMTITCNEGKQSYQVHPDDAYAERIEGKKGKVSGSVSLKEADTIRTFLFGHQCNTKEEFIKCVEQKDWEHLFRKVQVKDGDFLHTPAGVIHGGEGDGEIAVTFGSNGDITYRFYDYERNDLNRPLNLKSVYDCIQAPEPEYKSIHPETQKQGEIEIYSFYDVPGEYCAGKIKVSGKGIYNADNFYFVLCAEGQGKIDGMDIKAGETMLISQNHGNVLLEGTMSLFLLSYKDAE